MTSSCGGGEGQRHDGTESRKLPYEDKPSKGAGTIWDAPGMQRIKVPFGGLNPEQLLKVQSSYLSRHPEPREGPKRSLVCPLDPSHGSG